MGKRLTLFILIGMVLGLLVGFILNQAFAADDPRLAQWADYLKLLPDVFLRLIKMIIAPLVFGTIVAGIAGMTLVAVLPTATSVTSRFEAWNQSVPSSSSSASSSASRATSRGIGLSDKCG